MEGNARALTMTVRGLQPVPVKLGGVADTTTAIQQQDFTAPRLGYWGSTAIRAAQVTCHAPGAILKTRATAAPIPAVPDPPVVFPRAAVAPASLEFDLHLDVNATRQGRSM